ncbi:MFS transporter [Pelagicoccus albus]
MHTSNPASAKWLAIVLVSALYSLAFSQIGVLTTLFPLLKEDFELSNQQLGTFSSIYLLARATFGTIWGFSADKFGQKRILLVTFLASSSAMVTAGLSQNYSQLITLYAVSVLFAVAAEPLTFTLSSTLFDPKDRGKAFGAVRALRGLAGGVLVAAIGWFGGLSDGWRFALLSFGALEAILAISLAIRLGSIEQHIKLESAPFKWGEFGRLAVTPHFILFTLIHIFATGMLIPVFLPTFLVEERGHSIQSAAVLIGVMKIFMIAGSLAGGFLGDRMEERWPMAGRLYLMIAYSIAFSLFTAMQFFPIWSNIYADWAVAIASSAIFPVGFAGCILPMLANVIAPQLRSASFAIMSSLCQGLSLAGFSTLIGTLSDHYDLGTMLFGSITIPYLLNILICLALLRFYVAEMRDPSHNY